MIGSCGPGGRWGFLATQTVQAKEHNLGFLLAMRKYILQIN